jgi:hypothetical protein
MTLSARANTFCGIVRISRRTVLMRRFLPLFAIGCPESFLGQNVREEVPRGPQPLTLLSRFPLTLIFEVVV